MNPLIELKQISVAYPNGKAGLENFDLTLRRGETVLLAGGTGSGKSTLALRMLNVIPHQIRAECRGDIFYDGISTDGLPPHRLAAQIQLVLQNPEAMLFSLTVEDNIHFGLENLRWPREKILARTEEMLKLFRLEGLRRSSPRELSGGEQQAAALSGVLSADPSLFILDEPLTYLDVPGKKRFLEHLRALKKEGKGLLLLEHRLDLVEEIADRIVVLRDGKKVVDAPAREISAAALKKEMGLRGDSIFSFPSLPAKKENQEALRFDDVSFLYKKDAAPVLNHLDFQIFRGEIAALLGPNGSGKSTLAACAAGLETPQQGEIWVNGLASSRLLPAERAKQIGLMFQRPEVQLFCRTVREELEFGAANIRLPEKEKKQRIEEEAEGLELTALFHRHPATLSRGEMRRLALACLLVMRPPVLILDEPSVGQDYAHLEQIGRRLQALNRQGHTILLVTHDHEFARQLASRTFNMEKGALVHDGILEPVPHI